MLVLDEAGYEFVTRTITSLLLRCNESKQRNKHVDHIDGGKP